MANHPQTVDKGSTVRVAAEQKVCFRLPHRNTIAAQWHSSISSTSCRYAHYPSSTACTAWRYGLRPTTSSTVWRCKPGTPWLSYAG